MTINEVLDAITTALATDQDILDWSQTNFNTTHLVYRPVDPERPPVTSQEPVIEIATGKRKRNRNTRCIEHQVLVACFIKNKEETTTDNITIR